MKEGAQVLDVLGRNEFEESHLPGAVHIHLRQTDMLGTVRGLSRSAGKGLE